MGQKKLFEINYPDDWKIVRFGELADFRNGINYLESEKGHPVKVLGVADFQDRTIASYGSLETVELSNVLSANDFLQEGDLLFVRSNGNKRLIGRCLLIKNLQDKITHSGFTIRARITSMDLVMPEYVNLLARSYAVRKQIYIEGGGTNISNLSQEILARLQLPIPEIQEQTAVVSIVNTWDSAIDQVEFLIDSKEKQRIWLMQQLLSGRQCNSGNGRQMWKECHLGEVFKERKELNFVDFPLLSITASRGVIPQEETDKKDMSNADKSNYKRIAPGDIGYNTMRMWQGVSALSTLEGIVSPAYTVCTPKRGILAEYARHLFKFPPIIHLFWRYSQGLVDDTLNLKFHNFAQIKVVLPDIPEQRKIAEVLDTATSEIEQLQKQLETLRKQKKGLMQQLLTGQRRVI